MGTNSDSDEDDQHFSKLQRSATRNGFTARFRVALGLSLILVIIGLGLVGLSTSSLVTNLGCSALALNSTCLQPSHPTVISSPRVTVRSTVAPTAIPTFMPSPTPTPGVAPSQAPTPMAFPELPDQKVVTNDVERYKKLIEGGTLEDYHKAYNLLSPDVQNLEPFSAFVKDPNYKLPQGCLIIGTTTVSQTASQVWDGFIPVTRVSCVDETAIVYYSWHFRVSLVYGLPEITSLGLYPTGSQNQ